jgi:hypothetical protein
LLVANYLKMLKRQQVLALLDLGWTYRRIEAETGVRRETVSRHDRRRRANAAKVFPGSEPPDPGSRAAGSDPPSPNAAKVFPGSELPQRSAAAVHHDAIVAKLKAKLTVQRVWQDLVAEFGYGHSYESLKRYVRKLEPQRRLVGVIHAAPGEDYGESPVMVSPEKAPRGGAMFFRASFA